MGAGERVGGPIRAHTHHQLVTGEPDGHVAVEQEGQASEHRRLGQAALGGELPRTREMFVEGQGFYQTASVVAQV